MALFNEALIQELTRLIRQRYQELGVALGESTGQESLPGLSEGSSLHNDLRLLLQIAHGEHTRASATKVLVRRVERALQHLMDLLLGNALHTNITIPDEFWRTEIGILASRARWWLSADELITISNAAALAFGENTQAHRMRIARAIDHGLLEWVPDPSVANPQQNKRVLLHQVERLREQRRLPE
jgi:hypothetical protein